MAQKFGILYNTKQNKLSLTEVLHGEMQKGWREFKVNEQFGQMPYRTEF